MKPRIKCPRPVRRKPASTSAPRVTPEEAARVERQLELARAQRAEAFALGLCDADGFTTKAGLAALMKGTLDGFNPPPKKRGSLICGRTEGFHACIVPADTENEALPRQVAR